MWSSCQTSHIVPLLSLQKKKKKTTKDGLLQNTFLWMLTCLSTPSNRWERLGKVPDSWHPGLGRKTDSHIWSICSLSWRSICLSQSISQSAQLVSLQASQSVNHPTAWQDHYADSVTSGQFSFVEDLICVHHPSQGQKRRRLVIIFHWWTANMTSSKSSSSCYEDNINVTFPHKHWHWFWTLSAISSRTLANIFRFMTMQKKRLRQIS